MDIKETRGSHEPVITNLVFNLTSKFQRKFQLIHFFCLEISANSNGLTWFSSLRGKRIKRDLLSNMFNLHNLYKSAKINISQKNLEYMLNYSLP